MPQPTRRFQLKQRSRAALRVSFPIKAAQPRLRSFRRKLSHAFTLFSGLCPVIAPQTSFMDRRRDARAFNFEQRARLALPLPEQSRAMPPLGSAGFARIASNWSSEDVIVSPLPPRALTRVSKPLPHGVTPPSKPPTSTPTVMPHPAGGTILVPRTSHTYIHVYCVLELIHKQCSVFVLFCKNEKLRIQIDFDPAQAPRPHREGRRGRAARTPAGSYDFRTSFTWLTFHSRQRHPQTRPPGPRLPQRTRTQPSERITRAMALFSAASWLGGTRSRQKISRLLIRSLPLASRCASSFGSASCIGTSPSLCRSTRCFAAPHIGSDERRACSSSRSSLRSTSPRRNCSRYGSWECFPQCRILLSQQFQIWSSAARRGGWRGGFYLRFLIHFDPQIAYPRNNRKYTCRIPRRQ